MDYISLVLRMNTPLQKKIYFLPKNFQVKKKNNTLKMCELDADLK